MEYEIIASDTVRQMNLNVQGRILEGWLPAGGVSSIASRTHVGHFPNGDKEYINIIAFHQAMTRTCKPSKTAKKSGLQPKAVIDLWNKTIHGSPLSKKLKIIPALESTIRNRINEKDGFPELEDWRLYFLAIIRSDFLTGQTDRGNWKASLDWAVKSSSIVKVIENRYHSNG